MRNLKKFLALVMAMVMAFSLMLTANAASKYDQVKEWTDKDQVTEEFVEAVDVLSGMKVFQGDEDGFRPGSTITRAETAALIYRLATGDVENVRNGLYANYGNFVDVNENDWFAGYVGYCANAGYIKGHGGYFNPYDSVTGYEALAMILRAVGYDKNHEFEGATWQTNVSALGTRLGVLDDVKTSDYANTLHLPSRRDVVASILFACANIPTVTYTPSLGYETNKFTDGTSDGLDGKSLGKVYFGLTKVEGIIVGNQDTGESKTIINSLITKDKDGKATGFKGYYEYFYDNDQYLKSTATAKTTVTTSAKCDAKTGIDMFGHKVKVWYNADNKAGTTYALYDNVKKTALVTPLDATGTATSTNGSVLSDSTTPANAALGRAAQKAGFDVDLKTSEAVFNQSFQKSGMNAEGKAAGAYLLNDYNASGVGPTDPDAVAGTDDGKATTDATSLTMDGETGNTAYPLYLLISNNDDLTVDMIVALNVSVSRITQVNAYASIPTVTVAQVDVATDNNNTGTPLPAAWNDKKGGMIDQKALTATSDKALDTPVVGVAIVGTKPYKPTSASIEAIGNKDAAALTTNLSYRLSKPLETVEGTVTNFNYTAGSHDGSIVIGGKKIERSLLADAISQYDPTVSPAVPPNRGMTAPVNLSATAQLYGNYRAYLDEEGKYIWIEPIYDTKFVYATYLDYTTPYGSSTYEYTLIGVDLNGEQVKQVVKTIDGAPINASNYQKIAPYRDSANVAGVTPLFYQGFLLDGAGNLTSISDSDRDNNKPGLFDTIAPAVYQAGAGASSDATANRGILDVTNAVVIDTTDAKLGTVNLAKGTNTGKQAATTYFTNDTKFIVVDGAGTDTQKVEVYNGLTEFLKGGSKVTITGANALSANKAYLAAKPATGAGIDFNEQMYYTASPLSYASVDGTNPVKVDTIVLPKEAITWAGASGLYFIGNNAQDSEIKSGLWDPDGDGTKTDRVFHLYTMYLDGEKTQVWLTNDPNGGTKGIDKALDPDSFYKLEDTGMKTPMGDTVYHAHDGTYTPVAGVPYYDDDKGIVSESTTGTRPTLPYTTAPILGDKTNKFYYEATTYASQTATIGVTKVGTTANTATDSAIYNVADAKVVNLNAPSGKPAAGCVWPGITDLGTLNDAASTATVYQTNRPRVAVQLDPTDNLKVQVIYVCWDQN